MSATNQVIILGTGQDAITVFCRKSPRAKQIIIQVGGRKGVELIIPKRASFRTAKKFLESRELWIRGKLFHIPTGTKTLQHGDSVPYLGVPRTIEHSGKLRGISYMEETRIVVSGPMEHSAKKVKTFLKNQAKERLTYYSRYYAEALAVTYAKMTIRDTSTRWGSCSRAGNLSFSWRLIMAPEEILKYVAAHEVAHLIEMNHSIQFWSIVERLCPDYKQHRQWLRQHGHMLHAYD